jgi:ATP-dependent Clp protease ATP-binding subunit ClpC
MMASQDKLADFNDHARAAVTLASSEAGTQEQAHIGTEHLLVGLMLVEEGMASKLLRRGGIYLAEVRGAVESQVSRTQRIVLSELMASSRVEEVFSRARAEAHSEGAPAVGTEHLLLGLLEEPESVGGRVLVELGVDLESVRAELARGTR